MQQHVLARRWIVALCGALVLGTLGALPASHIAAATTYTVNALTDTGAGAGTTGDLRYAINQVNAGSGGDTINITVTGAIFLSNGLPALTKNVTITGPDATLAAVDGNTIAAIFTVNSGVTASISGLSIQHSVSCGITNLGTLRLSNATLARNVGSGGVPGQSGYAGPGGPGNGGGIANLGVLIMTNVTVTGNTGGTGGFGGSGHTFAGSGGNGGPGGISNSGVLTMTNVTVSGNTGGAAGSGGYNDYGMKAGGDGSPGPGNLLTASGATMLTDTLVAGGATNCLGSFSDGGYNLEYGNGTPTATCGFTLHNQSGDPRLGALGYYGGTTPTLPLLFGSAAIDTGGSSCPATDQRGVSRPQSTACDIGAYEAIIVNSLPPSKAPGPVEQPTPIPLPPPHPSGAPAGSSPAPLPIPRP